jgi:hypothetical protein
VITPCVNVRATQAMAPHRREVLERLLDRTGAHVDSDGHALIECDQPAAAKQMAALLRHLGATAHTIHLGEPQ